MRKPFFKKSHNAWYVHHQGRMIRLSDDKETAFQMYHELKASQAPVASTDSVVGLLNCHLEWCQKNRAETTYDWYREFLSSFHPLQNRLDSGFASAESSLFTSPSGSTAKPGTPQQNTTLSAQ